MKVEARQVRSRRLRRGGFVWLGIVLPSLIADPGVSSGQWLDLAVPPNIEPSDENIAAGKTIYDEHCYYCHGEEGDGLGPIAEYLWPRPRDFTAGTYKLRTTLSGELPTDEDVFRTVSLGIPGTAMPEWRSVLDARERWQVVHYIKTFSPLFEDPDFNPYDYLYEIGDGPRGSAELVELGEQVYEEAECWTCHGAEGRGDGPSAPDLVDDWEYPIWALDLTTPSVYKGGTGARSIYLRMSTALNGTPMPSYGQTLTDEERWQVAYFVESLQQLRESEVATIVAPRVDAELPLDPDDEVWARLPPTVLPLAGQAMLPPRWQIPAVTVLTVRAAYNDSAVALHLAWTDRYVDDQTPSADLVLKEGWSADDTYPVLYPGGERRRGSFSDAIEVQFPERATTGPVLPHFIYGSSTRPVTLWLWRADRQASAGREDVAEERRGTGPKKPPEPVESARPVSGFGSWRDGRWQVVLKRRRLEPGTTDDRFIAGNYIPVAFHVWEGSNGEVGLKMATSSWYFLRLEAPMPAMAYVYFMLAVIGAAGMEYALVRWLRLRSRHPGFQALVGATEPRTDA